VRALVTGAGGFCGRHLLKHLDDQRVEVHTIGIRATSANHHHADLRDVAAVTAAVAAVRPLYVFHLAGVSGGRDVASYYSVNTVYAAVLFEALESARIVCPVLLVGTAAEYGLVSAGELPVTELAVPRPYSHYGVSKLAQTQMGLVLGAAGRPVVVVRPFNVIGVGMPDHGAVQSFARQIADVIAGRRDPVVEVGNLETFRDFVDVEDVVRIYWRLIQAPAAYGQIINICSGTPTSLRDIFQMLVAAADGPVAVKTDPARVKALDIDRHYGSADRLRAILGDSPSANVHQTLKRIMRELIGHP
jgi:GDP-4-dehydro-6-deoxy-D-mannose reductase